MAKARAIIKRRKSVQNIRKITRTMELIATARFKKALDRATAAEAYTRKIAEIVADLGATGASVNHPLLAVHPETKNSRLLILTSNRGLAGGYNGNVLRASIQHHQTAQAESVNVTFDIAGKRGINYAKFRGLKAEATYTHFEDRPQFAEVELLADQYIQLYTSGQIDRLDVAYTRFISSSRQEATVQTLLPMTASQTDETVAPTSNGSKTRVPYEFLPHAGSILEEIVPVSFKVRLFKCFLDAAVSEQISRMVAMRGATENADDMIKALTRLYNRARQAQITRELAEIIGGAAALE